MKKKIIITLFLIIILIQSIVPIKTNAFIETREVISVPAEKNNYSYYNNIEEIAIEDNETTGLNLYAGILMEPTVKFFTFVLDSIMSVFTGIMRQEEIQFVMLKNEDKDKIPNLGNDGGASFHVNKEAYETATKKLNHLEYPRFTYTPENIFSGEIDLFDINFIKQSNSDGSWLKIRSIVSEWYKILRMVAIIGLLSILIYTGIKIMLSSNSSDKAKYKQMIVNWFIAVILAFSMHYIMAFILAIMEEVLQLFDEFVGVIQVSGDAPELSFKTNLMGLARFQIQQKHFSGKIGSLVIYSALVIYTFKFTVIYFKRVLKVAFLTIISPIVAITYPIDKMNDGKAQGFDMWLKEYIFNALLQPMHYILYYILVSSSLSLAVNNPIYGIVALMFISQAEKLLKRIFGFDKARAGTVGGLTGAFATGAITSSLISHVKDPLHPLSPGKGNGKSGGNQLNSSYNYDDENIDFLDDTTNYDELSNTNIRGNSNQDERIEQGDSIISEREKFLGNYRRSIPITETEIENMTFDNDGLGSIDDILALLYAYEGTGKNPGTIQGLENYTIEDLKNLLRKRVEANESEFMSNDIPLQYIDGDKRSSGELIEEIMKLNKDDATKPLDAKRTWEMMELLKRLKSRMAQNQYIERSGGALNLIEKEEERLNSLNNTSEDQINDTENQKNGQEQNLWNKFKRKPVVKGVTHVGKKIIKPVWDTEKGLDWKYNGKRLAGNILKGAAGVSVGVAAAAVQAGISITDGKYNPAEGAATFAAGMAGTSRVLKTSKELMEERNKDNKTLERYSEQWFNRDDVISNYNMEYPGEGKAMRRRAVNNYVSRGITDFRDQKQAMKYANMLKKERGLHEEEADKIAVATLQYKKNLTRSNSYMVLFDKKKRENYLNTTVNAYLGSASKDSIRKLHDELIENVRDFDRVNN